MSYIYGVIPSWEVDRALLLVSMAEMYSSLQLILWEAGIILVIQVLFAADFSELRCYKKRRLL